MKSFTRNFAGTRLRRLLFVGALLILATGCGSVKKNKLSGSVNSSSTSSISISPDGVTLSPGASQQFTASGGTSPYYFYVTSGLCNVNNTSGLLVAALSSGPCTIEVMDSEGLIDTTTVTVSGSGTSSSSLALSVQSQTIVGGTSMTLSASGGVAPYTYSVVSGGGSVSGTTYTAPLTAGTVYVQVVDSLGSTAGSYIYVTDAAANMPLTRVIIESVNSPEVIDLKGKSHSDGARIQQWRYQPPDNNNQKWTFQAMGSGDYTVVSIESSKCLVIDNGYGSVGAMLTQATCNSTYNQLFKIQSVTTNSFQVIHKNSGLCWEVVDASTLDGARIQLATCSSTKPNQLWRTLQAN